MQCSAIRVRYRRKFAPKNFYTLPTVLYLTTGFKDTMRRFAGGVLMVVVLGAVSSCFVPPDFPTTPSIEFAEVFFRDVPSGADTLALRIRFQDGDGDVGLRPDEFTNSDNQPAYAQYFYFEEGTNLKLTTRNTTRKLVNFRSRRTVKGYDTLPAYVSPFNCLNWELVYNTASPPRIVDTVYFQSNPNFNNIFVEFYTKNANGSFSEYDWKELFCVDFNGRLPRLQKEGVGSAPLEGTITYPMRSVGFLQAFGIRTLKLRVWIQDRALRRSNVIETPEFTLQNIRR